MSHGAITQSALDNGMALIEIPMSGRLATTIAIAFPGGACHERADEVGVAHLLEHMAFKGSEDYRSAIELNRAAEYLGTELDASTDTNRVDFSAVVRTEAALATIDLLTDVAGRPLLDAEHLEPERAVVLQEIADANEDPAERAEQRMMAALFSGQRLAIDVAGSATDVRRITHERLLSFRARQWSTEGGVAVIAGNLEHLDRRAVTDRLLRIPAVGAPPPLPSVGPFRRAVELEQNDGDVVHLRLAYEVQGLDLSRPTGRAVAQVYSTVLGGAGGSRLFEELREQRGLCYWIDGYVWGERDASFLSVDCSVDPANLAEVYEQVQRIIADLGDRGPTQEEHQRARSYALGSSALGFESTAARADHAVELMMEYADHEVDPLAYLRTLESVTERQVAQLSGGVRPGPCVGCVGPVSAADFS